MRNAPPLPVFVFFYLRIVSGDGSADWAIHAVTTRGAKVERNSSNYKTVWKVGKVVLVIRNRYTRRRRDEKRRDETEAVPVSEKRQLLVNPPGTQCAAHGHASTIEGATTLSVRGVKRARG